MEFTIRDGRKEDAEFIAEAIMEAIGAEICLQIGRNGKDPMASTKELFRLTAVADQSQYSYKNALVAEDPEGNRAGVIINYDGAKLHELRLKFVEVYNSMFGTSLKEEDFDDETDSEEVYIDTLAVEPRFRRKGLGCRLIEAAIEKNRNSGKPMGLLVDYDNINARRLYEDLGFKSKGGRNFCGVEMEHMQKPA